MVTKAINTRRPDEQTKQTANKANYETKYLSDSKSILRKHGGTAVNLYEIKLFNILKSERSKQKF